VYTIDAGIFDHGETSFAIIRVDGHVAMGSLIRTTEQDEHRDVFYDRFTVWVFFFDPLTAAKWWSNAVGLLPPWTHLRGRYVSQIGPYPPRIVGARLVGKGCFRVTAGAQVLRSSKVEQIKRSGVYVADEPMDDAHRNYLLPPADLLMTHLQQMQRGCHACPH
jgi:hypothetical protein